MATLIDPATLRNFVETDLGDTALQILLDDADAEIISRLGALGAGAGSYVKASVGELMIWLPRRATAITSCVERVWVGIGNPTEYNLTVPGAAAPALPDLKLHADGYRVERLMAGDNPSTCFRGVVTLAFTPVDTTAQRKRLEIDLVKLALQFDATASSKTGDQSVQHLPDYQAARDALFRPLQTSKRRLIV
jgi:hypothetical protein